MANNRNTRVGVIDIRNINYIVTDPDTGVLDTRSADILAKSGVSGTIMKVTGNMTISSAGKYINSGASDYNVTIVAGLGTVELIRGATNDLIAIGDSGVVILGSASTSSTVPHITLIEVSSGQYRIDSTIQSVKTINGKSLLGAGNAGIVAADVNAAPSGTGPSGAISATDIGLGNVNNTSDLNKPVSTAQLAALSLKTNIISTTITSNTTLTMGGKYINGGAANYNLIVPVGMGSIELIRGATNDLTMVAGSGVTLTGTTSTSAAYPRVMVVEVSPGVYRGDGIGTSDYSNLPTSLPGTSGVLWNNGGILCIS